MNFGLSSVLHSSEMFEKNSHGAAPVMQARAVIGGVMVSTCLVNVGQRAEDSGASLKNWKMFSCQH